MPADTSVPEIRAMKQLSRKFVDEQLGPDTPCKIIGWGYETDDDGRFYNRRFQTTPRMSLKSHVVVITDQCNDDKTRDIQ